jgi:3-isopropylmalate/(R)-2-methylmalate dehydratase large subunit
VTARKKKIPTKTELQQLQKLYKTDEKIGERLGGVPSYLIAYWRRKKGIPKYSLPKFSENEVRNLWERFGDDEKAGLELGISKAAFYNWRRRYGIKEKPAFLKLEQLELDFPGSRSSQYVNHLYGKRTIAQKIFASAALEQRVEVGDEIEAEPHLVTVNDCQGEVLQKFKENGPEFVFNPNRLTVQLGNCGLEGSRSAATHAEYREFVRRQGIKSFFDLREGVCHQVILERGLVLPGYLVVGTTGLTVACGSLGALACVISTEQMAELWSSGKCRMTVPETIRINITGRRHHGVFAKDIVLWISRELEKNKAKGKVIEYGGSVVTQMSISERYTLASMSVDMGAFAAICSYDATTRRYLNGRSLTSYKPVLPDRDADYSEMYQISIDQLRPQVRFPGSVFSIKSVIEAEGTQVNQVVIGTCTSGRFDDLRVAAEILKGKQVHPDCRVFIFPGSRSVYLEALKKGLVRVFVEAGAMVMSPGCEPFGSPATGQLGPGEKCLATTSLTLNERLGAGEHEVFLCSPATAAASALSGTLVEPSRFLR